MSDDTDPTEYRIPANLGTRPGYVWLDIVTGTPTTGLWCETCLLPSRYEVALYMLGVDGPVQIGTVERCTGHQP